MLTDKKKQFNLTDEILEAAKTLIEEKELISDELAITKWQAPPDRFYHSRLHFSALRRNCMALP